MAIERVLVSGAGIAGSITAYWLAKSGFQVVVVERSKVSQKQGQGLEIERPALKVVEAMGIMDKLEAVKTGELGFNLVDQQSRSHCLLKAGQFSPTGALEVMRGDFTDVLYKTADALPNVTYHYETTIQSLRQTGDKVIVDLEDRNNKTTRTEEFDFVIGADGAKSRTRSMIMGSDEKLNCLKPVGAFVAYFSIPKQDQDWPYSRLCHFPDRRLLWLRPIGPESEEVSVHMIHVDTDVPALRDEISALRRANDAGDRLKQKAALAGLYSGAGWEVPRVTDEMIKTKNFYCEELKQVKLQKWSQDRVALVGDSAWAPTPFTGQGNQLAIIGAWVLAQELSRNRSSAAFENYEKRMRPYVKLSQEIPLNGKMPKYIAVETTWGIWVVRKVFTALSLFIRFLVWTKLTKLIPAGQEEQFDLEIEKMDEVKGN